MNSAHTTDKEITFATTIISNKTSGDGFKLLNKKYRR